MEQRRNRAAREAVWRIAIGFSGIAIMAIWLPTMATLSLMRIIR